jgi:hypothetical protein
MRRSNRLGIVFSSLIVAIGILVHTAPVIQGPISVNRNAPFNATSSPWNQTLAGGSVWQNETVLHTAPGPVTRRYYNSSSDLVGATFVPSPASASASNIWWANPGDPTWSFVFEQFTDTNFHRDRPAITLQARAPAAMRTPLGDTDHIISVADAVTGTYEEAWHGFTDTANHIAANSPDYLSVSTATSTTATTLVDTGANFTGTAAVGDTVFVQDAFLQVTTVTSATTLTGAGGWIKMDTGGAAVTPGNVAYFVTKMAGTVTSGGGTSTITDSTKTGGSAWSANQYAGSVPHVVLAGTVWGILSANATNSLTVTSWTNDGTGTAGAAPANGTPYFIEGAPAYATGNASTTGATGMGAGNLNAGGRAANYSWIGGAITGYDITAGRDTATAATTLTDTGAWQSRQVADAVTNATPTVTSATAAFVASDLGRPVSGTNIPAGSFVGVVNSGTSIGISSSAALNVTVNATGSGSGGTLQLGAGWPANTFVGYIVNTGSSNGATDDYCTITANTATQLTCAGGWKLFSNNSATGTPPAAESYWITNAARTIPHALAVALPNDMLKIAYTAPATAPDNCCGENGPIPMGEILGVPSGTAEPAGMSFFGDIMWHTLLTYGAYVADFVGADKPLFYFDGQSFAGQNTGGGGKGLIAPFFYWFDSTANTDAGTTWNTSADMPKIEPQIRLTSLQPTWLEDTPTGGAGGSPFSYTFTATSSHTLTYTLNTGALPTGLTLNSGTGVLSGTPSAGNYTYTLKASDGAGPDAITPTINQNFSAAGVPSIVVTTQCAVFNNGDGCTIPATSAGDTLIGMVSTDGQGLTSVTDNGGGTWTRVVTNAAGAQGGEIWRDNGSSGATTITFHIAAGDPGIVVDVIEVANLGTTDQTGTTGTTSNSPTATTITPATANELFVFASRSNGFYSSGPTNGWTFVHHDNHMDAYHVNTTGGADGTSFTTFTSDVWAGATAAFNHT